MNPGGESQSLRSWLFDAALPLWWNKGADHERGGFHEALDGTGEPVAADRRARVQARQIYTFATAGALGWPGPWRQAVDHGLEFFLRAYRRPDGLFRTMVSPTGATLDDTAWLYDQAFSLFALAQATRAGVDGLHRPAHSLRTALEVWRLGEGGFREASPTHPFQSNPHMHLLEASLAWSEIDDDPAWTQLADEIVSLALTRFIDTCGQLHEYFAPDWSFAPGVDGRIVEPGHQFEWAWLIERWARLRGRETAHRAAVALYEAGQRGIDRRRGVANQQLLDDGRVHDPVARLWPQTEWLKAATILADKAGAAAATQGLRLYLDRAPAGLWWDKLRPDGAFADEPAPASSFYHIICAISETVSAAG